MRWATVATIDMGRKEGGGLLCPFKERGIAALKDEIEIEKYK